ncbi:hypothetical protein [Bacillus sp. JJ722]
MNQFTTEISYKNNKTVSGTVEAFNAQGTVPERRISGTLLSVEI